MPNDIQKSRRGSRQADPQRGGPLAHLTTRQILIAIHEDLRFLSHAILKGMRYMGQNLTQLTASVARNTDVTASAIVLIRGLAEIIRNTTDPVELVALADKLDTSATAMATAILEHTPAAPAPEPIPEPEPVPDDGA